ncbi:shikimate dehydrogenase family protein [Leifsonia sp. A12D58]|uniref:shikimate dehydrogenase family protein n=1 Tax=Leifsonia sp. A12D58 TaxID=3397674 RepID=UPI0039DFCE65
MNTQSMANRLAVLGSPIAHSQSPALHLAAYKALGLDWEYEAVEVKSGELAAFIASRGPEWRGLSLTMPLKQEVLPLVTDLSRVAQLTDAANTVVLGEMNGERTLSGFNTDVTGIVRALAEIDVSAATHVAILGAGATAASALAAAAEIGAESVEVFLRTPSKAAPLVALGRTLGLVVGVSELAAAASGARADGTMSSDVAPFPDVTPDVVISTLPGGTDLGDLFSAEVRSRVPLFDVAYSPWPSALAQSWTAAGGQADSGLGMLLHQALIQVRIFVSGDPFALLPDEEAVLTAMRNALA